MDRWKAIALVLGGMLVGTLIVPPRTTTAEAPGEFKECAYYCPWAGREVMRPSKLEKSAHPIPTGWSVVGASDHDCVLLCR